MKEVVGEGWGSHTMWLDSSKADSNLGLGTALESSLKILKVSLRTEFVIICYTMAGGGNLEEKI